MMVPTLTIIMAVHNALPWLPEAVTSVLQQTVTNFHLVVVDDASTDGSAEWLATLDDTRVEVLRMPCQSGQGAARNAAFARCITEFVAFADADDICLPDRFAKQMHYLANNPEIGLLGTHVAYLGTGGRQGFVPPLALRHEAIRADLLAGRHALVNATLMFRRKALARIGGFRIEGAGEDWDFFLRMTEATRAANLPEVLYLYRLHGSSTNVMKARELRLRYAHACAAARARDAGLPELDFHAFRISQTRRLLPARVTEALDARSSLLYRQGVTQVLHGHTLAGYVRLAFAALLSPGRLAGRLRRTLRPRAVP